jgi:spore maturation protein CgeB
MGQVTQIFAKHNCRLLVTVNEWGMDTEGVLSDYCRAHGITHVNWCVDDPFFEETIQAKKFRPSPLRFDFVSDKGYVEAMQRRGYNAFFLPLAVDGQWFHPEPVDAERKTWENDIVFVGNSYLAQMDDLLRISPGFVDTLVPFLGSVVDRYLADVEYDVEGHIARKIRNLGRLPAGLNFDKALFIAKQAAGYFGRKKLILFIAKRYSGFRVFGDDGWKQVLPSSQLGWAKYYTNLCETYRGAKITIDINRMVIRNGFTQRVFDVPASGGFVITSAKPCVAEYFETNGPGMEMATFKSAGDLMEKIDHYLAHDDECRAIALRGMKKVLGAHTYDHRMREIIKIISAQSAST